jgi:uncharacterized membrane protein
VKTESTSQGWWKGLRNAALGAVGMYLFDPAQGRRRRTLARDSLQRLVTKTSDAIDVAGRDLGNRLVGMQARLKRVAGRRGEVPDDQVLVERVRASLGRAVSHPHAIAVTSQGGCIELSGPVLAHERRQLLDTVRGVAGVDDVADNLEIHEKADGIPSLQGEGRRVSMHSEFSQENWTPALRAIAVAGGAVLGGYGATRRTPVGTALAAVGLVLFVRGAGNMPLKRMFGLGSVAQGIDLEKTINIDAPIETVFDVWTRYENFPYFMSHVVEVRDLGQQRSHWIVKGPAGSRLEWDAVLTESRRPSLLSWQTAPGTLVEHAGSVHFEPTDSGTRATVRMSYRPPAGVLGHGIAVLLGRDPKQELNDDLMRMKTFIERAALAKDAAKPTDALPRKGKKVGRKEVRPNMQK